MDFVDQLNQRSLSQRTLGESASFLAAGGIGSGIGFIGAGLLGRKFEDLYNPDAATAPTNAKYANGWVHKTIGWAVNNIPKIAVWALLRGPSTVVPGEVPSAGKEALVDATKALWGSVFFDTFARIINGGNPTQISAGLLSMGDKSPAQNADIQRLIQENSSLRLELNKALQKLASTVQTAQAPAPVVRPTTPTPAQAPIMAVPPQLQTCINQLQQCVSQLSATMPTAGCSPAAPGYAAPTGVTPSGVTPSGFPVPTSVTPTNISPVARPIITPTTTPVVRPTTVTPSPATPVPSPVMPISVTPARPVGVTPVARPIITPTARPVITPTQKMSPTLPIVNAQQVSTKEQPTIQKGESIVQNQPLVKFQPLTAPMPMQQFPVMQQGYTQQAQPQGFGQQTLGKTNAGTTPINSLSPGLFAPGFVPGFAPSLIPPLVPPLAPGFSPFTPGFSPFGFPGLAGCGCAAPVPCGEPCVSAPPIPNIAQPTDIRFGFMGQPRQGNVLVPVGQSNVRMQTASPLTAQVGQGTPLTAQVGQGNAKIQTAGFGFSPGIPPGGTAFTGPFAVAGPFAPAFAPGLSPFAPGFGPFVDGFAPFGAFGPGCGCAAPVPCGEPCVSAPPIPNIAQPTDIRFGFMGPQNKSDANVKIETAQLPSGRVPGPFHSAPIATSSPPFASPIGSFAPFGAPFGAPFASFGAPFVPGLAGGCAAPVPCPEPCVAAPPIPNIAQPTDIRFGFMQEGQGIKFGQMGQKFGRTQKLTKNDINSKYGFKASDETDIGKTFGMR